jgi:hypothetical protein
MRSMTSLPAVRSRGGTALRHGAAVVLLALAAACGSSAGTQAAPEPTVSTFAAKIISAATLRPGQSVPAPAGKPVFTMTGKISTANSEGALVFDQRALEQLGVRQVHLYEPWTKENLDFRGVWLQDLVAVAGVPADATGLHIVALDSYSVDLSMADIRAGGIMVATRQGDGTVIPIDEGGPTRIVFMDGVTAGANPDQWVWSIKTIDVR